MRANESKGGRYEFRKRTRFSLRKDELERRISELIRSTDSLRRLRETSASLYDSSTHSSSRTITKLAVFLQGIQKHAQSLYGAIAKTRLGVPPRAWGQVLSGRPIGNFTEESLAS